MYDNSKLNQGAVEVVSPQGGTEIELNESDTVLERVAAEAKKMFENARGSHDWEHTRRVSRLCRKIGISENADMQVVMCASFLHDIGRCFQDDHRGALCHAEKGAEMAVPVIDPLPLSKERKTNIIHCIRTHRFRGQHKPETTEARVLFDADKLDAIGAVGVARAYLFAGEVGACLHNPDMAVEAAIAYSKEDTGYREYAVKLRKIRDRILTSTGRAIAEERHNFMVQFFNRFLNEYEGKC